MAGAQPISEWRWGYGGKFGELPESESARIRAIDDPTARIRAYRAARGMALWSAARAQEREDKEE